jgi:hypothetical protein
VDTAKLADEVISRLTGNQRAHRLTMALPGLHHRQPGLPSQGIALIADRVFSGSPEVLSVAAYSPADWTAPSARS